MNYERIEEGQRFQLRGRDGVICSKPVYLVSGRSGLFYADVMWGDLAWSPKFMICRTDIKWVKA